LETYLRRYPDDPDGWYNLGEMALHAQQATGIVDDRVEEALYKAVELDPTFSPYYLHALEWASAKGERERFDSLMAGWERAGEEEAGLTSFRIRGDLLFGDEEQRAAAAEELGSLDRQGVSRVSQLLLGAVDRDLERLAPVEDEMARREMPTAETRMARYREEGRFAEAEELARADESWDGRAALGEIVGQRWRQGGADTAEVRAALTTLSEGTPPPAFRLGVAFARVGLASALRDRTAFDQAAPVVQANLVSAMAPLAARYDTAEVRTVVEEMVRSLWLQSHGQAAEAFHLMDGTLARELAAGRLAELAVDAGQWSDVVTLGEGVSRGAQGRSTAKYDLGRAYEALGDQERALDAYRTFLSRYEKADPGLAWVEEAKAAVARLGG
jgi:hypothetical protein